MFVVGYIFSMGLLADKFDDITNNINKIYMALLMAFSMGIYAYMQVNISIATLYIILCIMMIIFIREQVMVTDKQFLLSMIEHHSAALTMSKKINEKTKNEKIRELANNIIITQNKEIELMKKLLA